MVYSESGIRRDAQAALDFVRSHPLLKSTKLVCMPRFLPQTVNNGFPQIFFGQSIGGAVTIDLASRNPEAVSGVIVENTFLSIVSSLSSTALTRSVVLTSCRNPSSLT